MGDKTTSRKLFGPLPPGVDPSDPRILAWRQDRLEDAVEAIEEQMPPASLSPEGLVAALPKPLVVAGIALAVYLKPEIVAKLMGH